MSNSYSVEAYLKATGADQFSKAFGNAEKSIEGLDKKSGNAAFSIGGLVKAAAGIAATVGAIRLITGSLDGAISRYDTLNNFPRVLELLGFDAASSTKAVDKLSDGIDGLPTTLDSVASTTQRIAGLTGDLDGAVDTTLALNNAFLASGASTGDASRGLDQYVQMLSKGEVDLQSWRTLQETMPVALNKTAEAFGFTGKSAQNDLYDALKSGDITFDQFNDKVIDLSTAVGGFADIARESSGGIRTSWTNMKTAVVRGVTDIIAAIDGALGGVGSIAGIIDQMKSSISSAFAYVVGIIPILFAAISSIYTALQPWIPLIAAIATAFLVFNTIIAMVAKIKLAFFAAKASVMAFNVVLLANPIALIIALIAAFAIGLYLLYQRSETVRAGVDAAFQYIQQIVTQVVAVVSAFVMQVWGAMVAWWNANNTSIMTTVMTVWNFVQTLVMQVVGAVVAFVMAIWAQLTAFWTQHGQMILQAAQNVWGVIQSVISAVISFIVSYIQTMSGIIISIMQFLWPFILMLVQSVWNNIKGVIQGAISVITGIIQFFAALFTGNWSAMWDAVKQIVSGAVQLVWNLVQLWFVGKILKLGTVLASGLRGIVSGLWNTVRGLFSGGVSAARSVTSSGFNAIRSVVTSVMNAIRSVVQSIMNAVRAVFQSVMNAIRSVVTSILNAIRNTFTTVFNAVRTVVTTVINAIRTVITTVMNGIRTTITTILNGIKNTFSNIFKSLKGVVTTAFNSVKSAIRTGMSGALKVVTGFLGKFLSAGKNIVGSIADGIKGSIGKVTGAMGGIAGGIRNFLPFSPAKDGPLRDIMDIQVGQSIAKAIDKGRSAAVNSMASLASAVHGEMPNASIASDIGSLHQRSQRQMSYDYHNELSVNKQPARITLVLGNQEFERFVEDINEVNAVNDLSRRF